MRELRQKPKLPRGPTRQKWDMVHKSKRDYDRKEERGILEEEYLAIKEGDFLSPYNEEAEDYE
jgi:hypothetical protein